MKNKFLISAAAAVVALTGSVAVAQNTATKAPKPDVTRAEAQTKAGERFDKMDVNKDGKIDQADRDARRTEMREKGFAALDANNDGSISRAEWDAGAAKRGERHAARADARADGGPDKGPGKMGRRGHGGPGGKHGGFGGRGMMDANKDGSVTKDEAVNAALARFDKTDNNKDGTVTAAEREAAKVGRRGPGKSWQAGPNPPPAPAD